jgi:hypothetical protein
MHIVKRGIPRLGVEAIKDRFNMFPCLSDHMVWAIKRDAVAEHQPHVRNELLCAIVTLLELGSGLEGLDDMSLRSIVLRSIGFLIILG